MKNTHVDEEISPSYEEGEAPQRLTTYDLPDRDPDVSLDEYTEKAVAEEFEVRLG